MSAWKPTGRRIWETNVPTRAGAWVKRSTGTSDRVEARAIDQMLAYLGPRPYGVEAWDLLDRVLEGELTLAELATHWRSVPLVEDPRAELGVRPPTDPERLDHVRALLTDLDLVPLLEGPFFEAMTRPASGIREDSAKHYRAAVRTLIGAPAEDETPAPPFYRSQLTSDALLEWIEGMDDVGPGTVRKRGMGMRRFTAWLLAHRYILRDPMATIPLPPQGPPLCHYLETADAVRLADAQAGEHRLFSATLAGTALEVTTGLEVRVRAVSVQDREIHAPGTKTYTRDRVVRVAEWAWPAVLEAMRGKHPDSRLFAGIPDRWIARDSHIAAVKHLATPEGGGHLIYVTPKPYTLRDQRHTWAVRAVRSGWPIELVSRQLGHANAILALLVYAKFIPTQQERDRWEQLAAARDAAQGGARLGGSHG
jgi:integrase